MVSEFRLPALGADMESGTIVQWNVAPGDKVRRGQVVAVVETEKGAIDVEIFEDGVVRELVVPIGTNVPVGTVIARLETDARAGVPEPVPVPSPGPGARAKISPAARIRARELGVDISSLRGTGPDGAITIDDVDRARPTAAPAPQPGPTQVTTAAPQGAAPEGAAAGGMREAIASAMSRSKREIPHYYLSNAVDIGAAADWIARRNADRPPAERLLLGALFVKATALAARAFPEFNGFWQDGAFRPGAAIHVGVAISIRGGGLVAPAIHDTADLGVDALMSAMRDLVARVRAGRFRSSEIADPTITVSSLGERGVESLFGVIYPPQVAIVGFGKVVDRPWTAGGQVQVRPVVTTTLAADHRVSDGHRGALFLARIGELLQKPEAL